MDKSLLDSERKQKFNNWGEREPLVCTDENKTHKAMHVKMRQDLSYPEKSALFVYEISGCKGLEFVGFSNAKVECPIRLATGVILYPCFIPSTEGRSLDDPLVQVSYQMSNTGCYIYDGWLPIQEMNEESIRKRIRTLREVLGAFPLISGSKFDWQPKYRMVNTVPETHYFSEKEIKTIEGFAETIELAKRDDRIALLRSIGWLSECTRIENSESKFLFAVLAIESLSTYIEESGSDSSFHKLAQNKQSRSDRKKQRDNCIRQTLHRLLDENPTKAISTAYFDCVVGIKRRLYTHLANIFGEEDEGFIAFFQKPEGGTSLYELRHTIAHGSHDILSEFDRNGINNNIHKVERLALRYIWHVLNQCLSFYNESSSIHAKMSLNLSMGVLSSRTMYKGPVDMGLFYVK